MKTVDLNKVLEMLINEEQSEASGLLHEWFVEKTRQVHEELMREDDSLSQDIEDDQEAIESEEFYSEAEDDDAEGDEEEMDAEDEMDDEMSDMEADADMETDMEDDLPAEETIADTIEDLEAVMARLKAEFAEITGEADEDGAEEDVSEPADMSDEMMDSEEVYSEESFVESEEVDEDEEELSEEVTESEDDFDDLEESWNLEAVSDPNLDGGKEVGSHGAKVAVNSKSPIPQKKMGDRMGGEAVEIKAEEHHGHDLEAAPEVKTKSLLKNQVKKATDGRAAVSKEGDKSAMLNKKDGFGSDSPKSPISGEMRK